MSGSLRSSSLEGKWYAQGVRFSCTQCGNCCTGPPGFVWYSEDEGRAMAMELGVSDAEFKRRYTKKIGGRRSLDERLVEGLYDCVFLERHEDGRRTCSIYAVRPTQCRTWPVWESNLQSERHWNRAATTCPGMTMGGANREGHVGQLITIEEIVERLDKNPKGL